MSWSLSDFFRKQNTNQNQSPTTSGREAINYIVLLTKLQYQNVYHVALALFGNAGVNLVNSLAVVQCDWQCQSCVIAEFLSEII